LTPVLHAALLQSAFDAKNAMGWAFMKKAPGCRAKGLEHQQNSIIKEYYSIGIDTPGAMMPLGSTAFLMIFAIEK